MAQKRAPDLKQVAIQIRVSPKERKLFSELAASEHKSLGQLVRELLWARHEEARKKAVA